jgi:hypothetical protein
MRIFMVTILLVFSFSATMVWGEPFFDDFNRPDNDEIENDWQIQTDGTIQIEIVDEEVLVEGQQATDWVRCGISRTVEEETKIYFDFLANDRFNVHIRIDDVGTGSYIDVYAPPGGAFNYAAPSGGAAWPGWTPIPGSNMKPGQYNNLGIEKDEEELNIYLNEKLIQSVDHPDLKNITKVLIASDAATGTQGSLHIDNVVIGDPEGFVKAVDSSGKLLTLWGDLKNK